GSASTAFNFPGLERVAEHQLRDPLEPGLNADSAEVRVPERVPALQRAHLDAVEEVQHLDFDLRVVCTEPEILDEYTIRVVLAWRAQIGDRAWGVAIREWCGGRKRQRVQVTCRRMIGRREPI